MMNYLRILFYFLALNILSVDAQVPTNKFPVVAYGAVPEEYTNSLQYEMLSEAGVNIAFSHFRSLSKAQDALDLAAKNNVKILLYCPELFSETEKTVRAVKDHPGLGGYLLGDEPKLGRFAYLKKLVDKIKAIDRKNICYINLFPNYASVKQLGGVRYDNYLNSFFSTFNLSVYSFDHYPIKHGVLTTNWYENLEQFSRLAKSNNATFWAFVKIAGIRDKSEVIDMPGLKLQTFANLAYGAQGIQFYRYWSLKGQMFNAPISESGIKNPNYNKLKQITQYVENLTPIFLGSRVINVYHTNNTRGATTFRSNSFREFSFPKGANNLLVSHIENGKSRFVVFVNKDLKKANQVTMRLHVNGSMINKDSVSENVLNGSVYSASIAPGDLLILKYAE